MGWRYVLGVETEEVNMGYASYERIKEEIESLRKSEGLSLRGKKSLGEVVKKIPLLKLWEWNRKITRGRE